MMENQTTPSMHHADVNMSGSGMKKHWHWACCVLPTIATLFWIAAIVFAIAAWMSVVRNDLVWGYGAQWWIWNSLMFGILALFGKGKIGRHGGAGMRDCC